MNESYGNSGIDPQRRREADEQQVVVGDLTYSRPETVKSVPKSFPRLAGWVSGPALFLMAVASIVVVVFAYPMASLYGLREVDFKAARSFDLYFPYYMACFIYVVLYGGGSWLISWWRKRNC